MEAEGVKTLQKAGQEEEITSERSVDARYIGQGSETNIPVPESNFTQVKKEEILRRVHEIYEKLYGRTYPDSPVEFINFRVRASLPERLLRLPKIQKKGTALQKAVKGKRRAYSGMAKDFIPHTVYDRYKLQPDARFLGPAVVEERESTVIVGEDTSVTVDEYGFLWVDIKEV